MHRREMLHGLGLVALSGLTGCAGLGENGLRGPQGTLTIVLINNRTYPIKATATITDPGGTRVKTYSMGPLESLSSREVTWTTDTTERYAIRVEGTIDGEEWYTGGHWSPEHCPDYTDKTILNPGELVASGGCNTTDTP
jgi:hypothetical protein